MGVEFVFLESDRLADGVALLFRLGRGVAASLKIPLHDLRFRAFGHSQRLEDRAELGDGLVGASHDLLGDRGALDRIAVKQRFASGALKHRGQLPCQIEPVLNRGVRPQPVRWRMPVRRIAHDEDPPVLHVGRVHVVDGPSVGRDQLDLQFRVAHELPRHLRGQFFVHLGGGLVYVVAPDNQPFVPRAHHSHQPHADAAHVRAGLHDPVEHAGPMRDIFGQIRAEEYVHGPADAHLAFERKPRVFGDQRIAPVRAYQVL